MSGCIYALANKLYAASGDYLMIKVGMTRGCPFERAKELQTTGVPSPFVVLDYWEVDAPAFVEKFVHDALKDRRVNKNREFFALTMDEIKTLLPEYVELANDKWDFNQELDKEDFMTGFDGLFQTFCSTIE